MDISTLMIQICELKPELEMLSLKYTSDLEEGDDLVQQTLIAALYKAAEFPESGQSLKKWIFSLMKTISEEQTPPILKVVHSKIEADQHGALNSVLDCNESLERRLLIYEQDLEDHIAALNSEQFDSETRFARNA
jgi:hypothetical protein